jgi:hypothetical protein
MRQKPFLLSGCFNLNPNLFTVDLASGRSEGAFGTLPPPARVVQRFW